MATKYLGAIWSPLGSQTEPRMTSHDIVCIHTMVGYLYSTRVMFMKGGYTGTESHFGIGGKWGSDVTEGRLYDGRVEQWQDLGYQADANLEGNPRVISIETADNAPRLASDISEWTPKQLDALVKLIRWLCSKAAHANCPAPWECHKSGIPMALIPDTKPGRRGIAYHAQGISPNRVSGGEVWSSVAGKECPGATRIKQLKEVVIPRVRDGVMPLSESQTIAAVIKALKTNIAKNDNGPTPDVETISVADGLRWTDRKLDALTVQLELILGLLEALAEGLLPSATPPDRELLTSRVESAERVAEEE